MQYNITEYSVWYHMVQYGIVHTHRPASKHPTSEVCIDFPFISRPANRNPATGKVQSRPLTLIQNIYSKWNIKYGLQNTDYSTTQHSTEHSTVKCSTLQCSIMYHNIIYYSIQYGLVKGNLVQYSIVEQNRAWYNKNVV